MSTACRGCTGPLSGPCLFITHFYRELLPEASHHGAHSAHTAALLRRGYQTIGQYRYLDWAVATLLLKSTSMLRISSKEAGQAIRNAGFGCGPLAQLTAGVNARPPCLRRDPASARLFQLREVDFRDFSGLAARPLGRLGGL